MELRKLGVEVSNWGSTSGFDCRTVRVVRVDFLLSSKLFPVELGRSSLFPVELGVKVRVSNSVLRGIRGRRRIHIRGLSQFPVELTISSREELTRLSSGKELQDELSLVPPYKLGGRVQVFPPGVWDDPKWVLEGSRGVFLGFLNTSQPQNRLMEISRNSAGTSSTADSLCRCPEPARRSSAARGRIWMR